MIYFLKTFCHVHQFTDPSVSSTPFLVSAFPLRYGSRKLSGTYNYSMAGPLSCRNLEFQILGNDCISTFISLSSQDYVCFAVKYFLEFIQFIFHSVKKKNNLFGKTFSIFSMV